MKNYIFGYARVSTEAAINKTDTIAVEAIRDSLMYMKLENASESNFLSEKVYRYSRENNIIEVFNEIFFYTRNEKGLSVGGIQVYL